MKQLPAHYYEVLEELQAVDFVIVDPTLYLDTHPEDHEAISQYNMYVKTRKQIKKKFEKEFGPLTHFGYSYSNYPWDWKEAPWPWQV
ncbi:spore coat protein CotJB [Rossellomorea vietnamensis]|uniref:Spore coat protein CotJB n=1 Tax=Rossellomorea vietnamensis TaxID=218284 RepID=A0ACD4C7G9_9BACI|nr:spore coat protein CotJB [Rossellomorea vietnamensis]UXH44610.1 spore coat protein CotJB [Rossellomorea vietnamensis]